MKKSSTLFNLITHFTSVRLVNSHKNDQGLLKSAVVPCTNTTGERSPLEMGRKRLCTFLNCILCRSPFLFIYFSCAARAEHHAAFHIPCVPAPHLCCRELRRRWRGAGLGSFAPKKRAFKSLLRAQVQNRVRPHEPRLQDIFFKAPN